MDVSQALNSEMLTANIRAKLYLISKSGKSEGQQWPHPLYLTDFLHWSLSLLAL